MKGKNGPEVKGAETMRTKEQEEGEMVNSGFSLMHKCAALMHKLPEKHKMDAQQKGEGSSGMHGFTSQSFGLL